MTFDAVYQTLLGRAGTDCGAGPAGFKRLLKRLGNPHLNYRVIHVAGTNGKGSVCHLCAEALQAAGYKTGLFVSPHLFTPAERIRINGRLIGKPAFAKLCQDVLAQEKEKLNFFEILTAAAFLYFSQQQVQYAVLETGLGGRRDPTNACLPAACLITSIGLDHCALLGHTLAQIAREKAGIIKCGVPVFCPPLPCAPMAEIRRAARAVSAPLEIVREGEPFTPDNTNWSKGYMRLRKGKTLWPLHILGEKQVQNACLVYQACRFLGVPDCALKKAFACVYVPCRFEVLRRDQNRFIFDGAHNPQAVRAFADFFARSPWSKNAALVCGFMRDKDYRSMLRVLVPHFSALYVTRPPSARAADLQDVRGVLPRGVKAFFFSSPARALRAAARARRTAAVTGSFYLAAYLRARKGLTAPSDCD